VPVYATLGTAQALEISEHHRFHAIEAGKYRRLDDVWEILPFSVHHDAADPVAYLIGAGRDGPVTLYVTDAGYIRERIEGITHLMIGCNHSEEILNAAVTAGSIDSWMRRRIRTAHMSIEQVLEFIAVNDWPLLKEVHLLHLSDRHADEDDFKDRVQRATGVPVYVAGK